MLFSGALWTICFILTVRGATKKNGELSSKNYRIHLLLAWLFLMFNNSGFKMLGWAVSHPSAITEYFFVQVGPIPAWFNLTSWAAHLIASIVSILIAFSLARRKSIARKRLLICLPILYPIAVVETVNGFYKADNESTAPLFVAIGICGILVAILYSPIFLFYKRDEIAKEIFTDQSESNPATSKESFLFSSWVAIWFVGISYLIARNGIEYFIGILLLGFPFALIGFVLPVALYGSFKKS